MPPSEPPFPQRLALLIVLTCLGIFVVYPGLVMGVAIPVSMDYTASDLLDVGIPLHVYVARALAGGHMPLWYDGCYGGLPVAALAEAMAWYPLTLPFYLVLPPARACAGLLAFHLLLAGVGAGLLARRFGAGLPGQILTALAVAVGLWLPNHFRQINLLATAAWAPWVWLALDRWLDRPSLRNAALLGLAGGFQLLAGHAQIFHHTAVVMAFWLAARLLLDHVWPRDRRTTQPGANEAEADAASPPRGAAPLLRRRATILVAALLVIAIGAPHLFPMARMAKLSGREQFRQVAEQERFPAHPRFLATLAAPFLFGSPASERMPTGLIYWEEAQYIGKAPLLLALAWLALGWRRRDQRRIWALLAFLILVSLWLAYARGWRATGWTLALIPGHGFLRFLQRYLLFVTLGLAVAAGLGLTALMDWLRRHQGLPDRRTVLLAAGIVAVALVDYRSSAPFLAPVRPPGALLEEPASSRLLRERGADPQAFGERIAVNHTSISAGWTALFTARFWQGSLDPYVEYRRLLLHQHAGLWGWQSAGGYVGIVPDWTRRAVFDQIGHGLHRMLHPGVGAADQSKPFTPWAEWVGLLGARWVTSPNPIRDEALAPVGVIEGRTVTSYIYENRKWAGPAWICHEARIFEGEDAAQMYLYQRATGFRSEIVTTERLPETMRVAAPPEGADERVEVAAQRPERLRGRCRLAAPGFVVVSLNYYPGWRYRVDGGAWQRPLRVNLSQTALYAPAGEHRFELRYGGRLEYACLGAALLALLVAVGVVARGSGMGC